MHARTETKTRNPKRKRTAESRANAEFAAKPLGETSACFRSAAFSQISPLLQLQKEKNKGNSLLAIYEKEQKQNETALGNIMTAVENGIFSATTNKRLRELEERQLELERLITTEKCKADIEIPASEIRKFYAKALEMEPTLLIDYLVKEIVVFNDEMHIYYNSPIETKSPDESQGFLLCEETENLTIYIQTTGVVDSKSMTVLIKI